MALSKYPKGTERYADGRIVAKKETRERNLKLAAAGQIELDSLGRVKAGPQRGMVEEEEQRWSNPENRDEWEMRWVLVPPDDRRCSGTIRAKNSPWLGNRCRAFAIHGGPVCMLHGGRLANVRKAAQRRLALAAPYAADRLTYIALVKPNVSDADRIKALLAILDRAGVEGKQTIEVEVKPWQQAIASLMKRMGGDQAGLGAEDEADDDENTIDGDFWEPTEDNE